MKNSYIPEFPILLVDDEESILSSMSKVLTAAGFPKIINIQDSREVLPLLYKTDIEVILLDLSMPHLRGEDLLRKIRTEYPEIPIIIVTASDDLDTAVRCMKEGAFDYMVKAVEPNRLISGIRRAVDVRYLSLKYSALRINFLEDELKNPDIFKAIITRNHRMKAIFRFIETIAECEETILITGETGTGKELIAQSIHEASGRKGELVKINTAGLDEAMFTDTLFGHSKGAYTGADQSRKGLVQQADRGTLFLDEISDLNMPCQIKLLRVLESGEYYALGSDILRRSSTRFVIASNRVLSEMVTAGEFRRDLYYRLQTQELWIPPLRERKDDLPALLEHFLEEASIKLSKEKLAVPMELLTLLESYDFPGNIRELRSMIVSAVSRQKEKMLSMQPFRDAMGYSTAFPHPSAEPGKCIFSEKLPTLQEINEQVIEEALSRSGGNQAIAAGLLGISPQALSKRLYRKRHEGET
jgi:DNA-binding NtrC family response regulator